MSIQLTTYANNKPITPLEDALVYQTGVTRDGIIHGGNVTTSGGNKLYISNGHGIIWGRKFRFDEQTISVSLASTGTVDKKLIIRLDLGNTGEPIKFSVIPLSTNLRQDANVNIVNGVWEMELATFTVTSVNITNLKQTFKVLPRQLQQTDVEDLDDNIKALFTSASDNKSRYDYLASVAQMYKVTTDLGKAIEDLSAEIDNIKHCGFRYMHGVRINGNRYNGHLIATALNNEWAFQIFTVLNDSKKTFIRVLSNGVWQPWSQLATTVAQMYKLTEDSGELKPLKGTGTDINTIIAPGFYDCYMIKNAPFVYGKLAVSRANNEIHQMIIETSTGRIKVRTGTTTRNQPVVWQAWIGISTTANKTKKGVVLTDGWQQYGGGWQEFSYRKTDNGIVHLQGSIKRKTSGKIPNLSPIGQLPTEIAPKEQIYLRVITGNDFKSGFISINTDGKITTRGSISSDWVCFDGVSYCVD